MPGSGALQWSLDTELLVEFGDKVAIDHFVDGDSAGIAPVLAVLEAHLERGDDYVRELVGVGFVENLDPPYAAAGGVRNLLGPELRAEYALTYPDNG